MKEPVIRELIEKWLPKLGLENWIINVELVDDYYPGDNRCEASIEEDLKYLEADLRIYNPFWDNDPIHQEKNIIHELVHLQLCSLHPYLPPSADDTLEQVVQQIAINHYNNG